MYGVAISRYNFSLMATPVDSMKLHQRILLVVTLTVLLLGLAAHSLPVSLCGCLNTPDDTTSASYLDVCLVCQLQTGIHTSVHASSLSNDQVYEESDHPRLKPLEHTIQVLHPPTTI
jgi:hypothetical protein